MLATELDFHTDWNAPPKNKKTKLYKSDTVPSTKAIEEARGKTLQKR